MELIKWEDNSIVIAPEAYGIKAFRDIWNADKSKDKNKAILELSILYFMYDPRSDFMFEVDEEVRLETIKEQTGVPLTWKPNKRFEAAIPVIKHLTQTTSALMLEANRRTLRKVEEFLEEVDIDDKNIARILTSIEKQNSLAVDVSKAEKEIYKDVAEHSAKMRGSGSNTIGDAGLGTLFKD